MSKSTAKMLSEIFSAGFTIKHRPNAGYVLCEDHRPWGKTWPISEQGTRDRVKACWEAMKFTEVEFDYDTKIPLIGITKEMFPSFWEDGEPEEIWIVYGDKNYDAICAKVNGRYQNYIPIIKGSLDVVSNT